MIVDVPFEFRLDYKVPQGRVWKRGTFRDTVPFEIPEVSSSEAPRPGILFLWEDTWRVHDDVLYERVHAAWTDHDLGQGWEADGFLLRESSPVLPHRIDASPASIFDTKRLGEVPMRETRQVDRDEMAAAAIDRASRLLLVDGVLHKASAGPLIKMAIEPGDQATLFRVFPSMRDKGAAPGLFHSSDRATIDELAARVGIRVQAAEGNLSGLPDGMRTVLGEEELCRQACASVVETVDGALSRNVTPAYMTARADRLEAKGRDWGDDLALMDVLVRESRRFAWANSSLRNTFALTRERVADRAAAESHLSPGTQAP